MMLEDARPSLLIATEDQLARFSDIPGLESLCYQQPLAAGDEAPLALSKPDHTAYIIFTSGSTGEPKGVPISRRNLNAFYTAYHRLGWQLDENDRMLQMFELTFDVSIVSFLYPLTLGACIYTVSPEGVKYINVIETLEKYDLTFAAVAPSLLQLLRPYFRRYTSPHLDI